MYVLAHTDAQLLSTNDGHRVPHAPVTKVTNQVPSLACFITDNSKLICVRQNKGIVFQLHTVREDIVLYKTAMREHREATGM